MKKEELEEYNDYELLYMIRQKDDYAFAILIKKYEDTILYHIKKYKKKGVYLTEDYYQLALVKMIKAIQCYREDREASFHHYYNEIIRYAFIDYYRASFAYNKYQDMYCLSLDLQVHEEGGLYTMMDFMNKTDHRENMILELLGYIQEREAYLKPVERKIIKLRLLGYSYRQIAKIMNINEKKVDNTIRKLRIKKTSES